MILASLWDSVEIKSLFRLANVQRGDGRGTWQRRMQSLKMFSSFQQSNAMTLFNQVLDVLVSRVRSRESYVLR